MHTEDQVRHSMRQDAWPEAVCLVEEEIIDNARHHAGEPEGMFTAKEYYRYNKRDGGKRSKWDRRELGGDIALLFWKKRDDKPEKKGPPEEFLHYGYHHSGATQPHRREQCPNARASLPRIVAGPLAQRRPGPVHAHPGEIDHHASPERYDCLAQRRAQLVVQFVILTPAIQQRSQHSHNFYWVEPEG